MLQQVDKDVKLEKELEIITEYADDILFVRHYFYKNIISKRLKRITDFGFWL
ncbi:hypothetical protein [Desulfonema magnum]|uniref:Uncharacterized protein n=1 Tax=Desulfonema magnum TaxID=45655 RepID=A0A975BEQ8_9BACT|nr:hypothetical protein [Desulfonema magnum]QTA84364.1 Uncharacterized protein dnm_003580 [Desulfonema magnum]